MNINSEVYIRKETKKIFAVILFALAVGAIFYFSSNPILSYINDNLDIKAKIGDVLVVYIIVNIIGFTYICRKIDNSYKEEN